MLSNFSFNDAYRVIKNVIDERINFLTKSGAGIEVTWGTVAEITSPYTCSVYLFGDPIASDGFRFENGIKPNLLDPVRVSIDKRGNRWVDAVLNDSTLAHAKLELDVRGGEVRVGDGTVAPTALALGGHDHDLDYSDIAHAHTFLLDPLPDASATISSYPDGISIGETSTGLSEGWPDDFVTVTTHKQSTSRVYQLITNHQSETIWWRVGHSSAFGSNLFSSNFYTLNGGKQVGTNLSKTASQTISATSTWTKITGMTESASGIGVTLHVARGTALVNDSGTGRYIVIVTGRWINPTVVAKRLGIGILVANNADPGSGTPAIDETALWSTNSTSNHYQTAVFFRTLAVNDNVSVQVWQDVAATQAIDQVNLRLIRV